MRIIAYTNGQTGCAYHRIIMPLLLMKDVDVFITNNLQVEHFEKGCDVFMYNRRLRDDESVDSRGMDNIRRLKAKYGFKVCIDIDDHWDLDQHHILHQYYKENNIASRDIKHIQDADIVLTTHSRLADEIKPINSNVYVCPNAIPKTGQFDIEREPCKYTRLFYQGSVTHQEDIALLRWPIGALKDISHKIKMVIAGYMEGEPAWEQMTKDYTCGYKHQYQILPGLKVSEYYSHYQHADICLIPLLNSPFNRMKSNLKVLEAANLGLPVICSQVHPYLDLPVLYAKSNGDWIRHIRRLVDSKKRQKEAGEELREYCNENFNFFKINKERKQILEHQHVTA